MPEKKSIDKGIPKTDEVEKEKKLENTNFSMIPMIKFSSYLRQDQESENKTENIKDKNLPEVIESKEVPDKKKSRNSHLLQCLEN